MASANGSRLPAAPGVIGSGHAICGRRPLGTPAQAATIYPSSGHQSRSTLSVSCSSCSSASSSAAPSPFPSDKSSSSSHTSSAASSFAERRTAGPLPLETPPCSASGNSIPTSCCYRCCPASAAAAAAGYLQWARAAGPLVVARPSLPLFSVATGCQQPLGPDLGWDSEWQALLGAHMDDLLALDLIDWAPEQLAVAAAKRAFNDHPAASNSCAAVAAATIPGRAAGTPAAGAAVSECSRPAGRGRTRAGLGKLLRGALGACAGLGVDARR